jgi:hypothetical protein
MTVGILDVMIDFRDQFLHTAERSPANGLLRDAIEPDLHLIEPGGIGWSEVHMESWSDGEPASHSSMLVGGVVVHNDLHF